MLFNCNGQWTPRLSFIKHNIFKSKNNYDLFLMFLDVYVAAKDSMYYINFQND